MPLLYKVDDIFFF